MKPKQQKRLEAIERLERRPYLPVDCPEELVQRVWGQRMQEAARLRRVFNHPKS